MTSKTVPFTVCCFLSTLAVAKDPSIETVEVTAQKRLQPMQQVPVGMSAASGEQIQALHLVQADQIVQISPNTEVTRAAGGMTNYFIRGIGMDDFNLSSVPAVGIYRDDVAVSNPMGGAFALYDIQRVEVLRGPQNTLFGKNTTAGAVNFYSVKPSIEQHNDNYLQLGFGNYRQANAEGAVEWLADDNTAIRISAMSRNRNGLVRSSHSPSRYGDIDKQSVRIQLLHRLSEQTELWLNLHYDRQDEITMVRKLVLGTGDNPTIDLAAFDIYQIDSQLVNPRNDYRNLGAFVRFDSDFDTLQLTSITTYDQDRSARMDDWGSQALPSPVWATITYNSTDTSHFSQEFRLTSIGPGDTQWLLGAAYNQDKGSLLQMAYIDPGGPGRPDDNIADAGIGPLFDRGAWIEQNTKTSSVYGRLDYQISPRWRSDVGLRWSAQQLTPNVNAVGMMMDLPASPYPLGSFGWYSQGSGNFDVTRDFAGFDVLDDFLKANGGPAATAHIDKTFHQWGSRIGLSYQLNNQAMLYFSATRGYKMGAVNSNPTTAAFASLLDKVVKPETLSTLEIGLKSDWLENRLRLNTAIFVNRWHDYQYYLVSNPGPPQLLLATLVNVPSARSKGAELNLTYLSRSDTRWDMSLGWLNGYINDADIDTSGIPAANLDTFSSQVAVGNHLTNTPKWNVDAGVSQLLDSPFGPVTLGLRYHLRSRHNHQLQGLNDSTWLDNFSQPAVATLDANASIDLGEQHQYRLQLWGKNLTDRQYCSERSTIPGTNTQTVRLCNQAEPLTFGIDLKLGF